MAGWATPSAYTSGLPQVSPARTSAVSIVAAVRPGPGRREAAITAPRRSWARCLMTDKDVLAVPMSCGPGPVSYTHHRAQETENLSSGAAMGV